MLSSEEKLQHFSQMIFQEAERQKQDILSQAEKECQLMQEKFETQCLEVAYKTIQKKITLLQKESNETVSRMQVESKQKLLTRREQMVEEVFAAVGARLEAFKETEAYPRFLEQQIRKGIADVGDADLTIYLDQSDARLASQISAAFPAAAVELLPAGEAIVGGARVYCRASNALSDQTLSFLLEQERLRFLKTSGLVI